MSNTRPTTTKTDDASKTDDTANVPTDRFGNEKSMIVHKERFIDSNGVQQEKVHGPMPVDEWPAYEKEHNL